MDNVSFISGYEVDALCTIKFRALAISSDTGLTLCRYKGEDQLRLVISRGQETGVCTTVKVWPNIPEGRWSDDDLDAENGDHPYAMSPEEIAVYHELEPWVDVIKQTCGIVTA